MVDLARFFRFFMARLDDDERMANNLDELDGSDRSRIDSAAGGHVLDYLDHFDPHGMLDDVRAKRRLLREYEGAMAAHWSGSASASARLQHETIVKVLERALRLLAVRYAGHPDYEPAWRPE